MRAKCQPVPVDSLFLVLFISFLFLLFSIVCLVCKFLFWLGLVWIVSLFVMELFGLIEEKDYPDTEFITLLEFLFTRPLLEGNDKHQGVNCQATSPEEVFRESGSLLKAALLPCSLFPTQYFSVSRNEISASKSSTSSRHVYLLERLS